MDAIDSLCQAAPHIIMFDPAAAKSTCTDLYRRDVRNERRILERSKKHRPKFIRVLTKPKCPWPLRLTHPQPIDPELKEALSLVRSVKNNCLAASYNVNASATHLKEEMKARREVGRVPDDAAEERKVHFATDIQTVNGKAHADGTEISHIREKNGITITTTAIIPSPSPSITGGKTSSIPPHHQQQQQQQGITALHHRRPSSCPSFNDYPAFEKCAEGGEEKNVLLRWGKGVDDGEMKVPRRRWWKRFLRGGRAW
ncbi:MAG: hypothetical protein Q9207_005149 [Kuettlingeria erythrocarpa]